MATLLTLNLNLHVDKHGPWEARRARIIEAIRQVDPDVVALQAVQQAGDDDPARALADALGYAHAWFHPVGANDVGPTGSGFISRVEMRRDEVCNLSTGNWDEDPSPRAVIAASFAVDGGDLRIFNSHYSWVEERAIANFEEAQECMSRYHGPRILAGDLNTPSDRALTASIMPSCDWVDAWPVLHGDADGFTFEADAPSIRIDYFFVTRDLAGRLLDMSLVGGTAPETRLGDHLGLALRLA